MPRGIDHLVIAVRDLAAARAAYAALGFSVTPVARHPWGTENSLVQFDGAFLELLAVADAATIPEPAPGRFSFGAFNRDALAQGEGATMLVLDSADEAADRAAFAARGLPVFEPFHFERVARGPDGAGRRVAFSLTFTAAEALPGIGFFTCRQHVPENFWNPAYQRHDNGVAGFAAVVIATPDPAAAAAFMAAFADAVPQPVAGGVRVGTARGDVLLLTPEAARPYGPSPGPHPRIAAVVFADRDGRPADPAAGAVPVPAAEACGLALVLPGGGCGRQPRPR